MKTILIKIIAGLGAILAIIAGIFFYGRSKYKEGDKDRQGKQRDAVMSEIEKSRKIKDKIEQMSEAELDKMYESDKRLQDK